MNNMTAAHILAFPILSLYFSSFHPSAVLCLQLISTMCSTEFAGKLFHCKAICPSFHLLPIPLPQLKPKPLAARAHLSLWHSGKRGSLPSPLSPRNHIEYRKNILVLCFCDDASPFLHTFPVWMHSDHDLPSPSPWPWLFFTRLEDLGTDLQPQLSQLLLMKSEKNVTSTVYNSTWYSCYPLSVKMEVDTACSSR